MEETQAIQEVLEGSDVLIKAISSIFGFVILLLVYIWNQTIKANNKRHEKHEEMLEKVIDNQTSLAFLTNKLEIMVEKHEKSIDKISP